MILDEPTAALDQESEEQVMEALERLMKGRTFIKWLNITASKFYDSR